MRWTKESCVNSTGPENRRVGAADLEPQLFFRFNRCVERVRPGVVADAIAVVNFTLDKVREANNFGGIP